MTRLLVLSCVIEVIWICLGSRRFDFNYLSNWGHLKGIICLVVAWQRPSTLPLDSMLLLSKNFLRILRNQLVKWINFLFESVPILRIWMLLILIKRVHRLLAGLCWLTWIFSTEGGFISESRIGLVLCHHQSWNVTNYWFLPERVSIVQVSNIINCVLFTELKSMILLHISLVSTCMR